jgi:hypothetical protein
MGQCAMAAGALIAVAAGLRGEDQSVTWLGSYREGLRVARETGKPLLVEFRCEA